MAITNTTVADIKGDKVIITSKGIGNETDQIVVDAEKLLEGTNESKVGLIECHYQIESTESAGPAGSSGAGILRFSASSESNKLGLLFSGKYGLRPDQLMFGKDKQIKLTTDSNVKSYLLVTEFRRFD